MSNKSRTASALTALALAIASLGAASSAIGGTVQVDWIDAAHFVDAGFGTYQRDRNLKVLSDHLQSLGRRLPDDQALKIEVLDVDLAGREDWRRGEQIRILRGAADWPRISLRWTLARGADNLGSGQADLADLNYLQDGSFQRSNEELFFEKRMLRQWFDRTISPPPAAAQAR